MVLTLDTDKFKLVGGGAIFDFVNTVGGRISNPNEKTGRDFFDSYRANKLETYADLLAWSVKSTLIGENETELLARLASDDESTAGKVLHRAVVLRESIYRLFKSAIEGWQPNASDLEILNKELDIARRHQKFSAMASGFGFEWLNRENSLDAMLWQVTVSTTETLSTADLTRLRQCGGEECHWIFLDTSRNRSRQWCDMKDCGNLAKARRFRQKQRETD